MTNLLTRFALAAAVSAVVVTKAHAITLEWVTVGDPGNTADTRGSPNPAGSVPDSFRIMKYEFTNEQYKDFLNAVAATDTYSLYNTNMGGNVRGGITRSGSSGSYSYSVKTNMGDKPVNYVSWFDAARVANWLMNGSTGTSSTETGAYTLVGGQTNGTVPAKNPGATFSIPTENEWYKAAYYKGGSANAGYWNYATQSDATPKLVTAGSTGIGLTGSGSNFANFERGADWNGQDGNVTTVGTNGGPSAYGAFDMSGNVLEWNDLTGAAGSNRGFRGGAWNSVSPYLGIFFTNNTPFPSVEYNYIGFRLAASVPEPATSSTLAAGLAIATLHLARRRQA